VTVIINLLIVLLFIIIINVKTTDAYRYRAHQQKRANMQEAAQYPNNTATYIGDTPKQYVLYKQCDSQWGSETLGTGSNTICAAGCAMSSVSMILATWGEQIDGSAANPGTLNKWLIDNNGYADGDLIAWAAVNKLGKVQFSNMYSGAGSLSASDLRSNVDKSKPTVVNVRSGSHWVLVVGYQSNTSTSFIVNDPGFSDTSYEYSCMSNYVVYSAPSLTSTKSSTTTKSTTTTASSSSSPSSGSSGSSPSSSGSSSPSSSGSSSPSSSGSSSPSSSGSSSPSSSGSSGGSSSSSPSSSPSQSTSSSPSASSGGAGSSGSPSSSASTAGRAINLGKHGANKKNLKNYKKFNNKKRIFK